MNCFSYERRIWQGHATVDVPLLLLLRVCVDVRASKWRAKGVSTARNHLSYAVSLFVIPVRRSRTKLVLYPKGSSRIEAV